MPHPEPDADFRARLLRVVRATNLSAAMVAAGDKLDALGRRYDRFRTGVPLKASSAPRSD